MGAYEINKQLLTNEEKKELTINKDQQAISRKKKCSVSLYQIQSQF